MPLGVGESFAGYTVVRKLGAGGMGEVYLVKHPRLPRHDALKLLASDVSVDPSFRERFLREADLASTLWHPHIVGVHDRGEFEDQLWISMDFVDGDDADSLMAKRFPTGMPLELVTAIVTAVASALDYAHKQGLLHRDIKPANIMLANVDDVTERRILLTDFGIARTVDDTSGLTGTNMTIGTVAYASPEQLMGEVIDGHADQYSLAATAYHLLTGSPPFGRSNPAAVIGHHLNSQPPSLADARPELIPLGSALATALAKNPAHRYATCSDFARAVAERAAGQPTVSGPVIAQASAPTMAAQLAPGWYPKPGGAAGASYWDGHSWHTPPPQPPAAVSPPTRSGRASLFVVAGIAVAALVAAAGSVLYFISQSSESRPSIATSNVTTYREPVVAQEPVDTPPVAADPGVSAVPPTPVQPQTVTGVITGTCDEGGSCGVKQRTGPYTNAPRLHPNDLHDGTTVTLVCQTTGDVRSSDGHGSSNIWFRLENGAYVNSVYFNVSGSGLPSC